MSDLTEEQAKRLQVLFGSLSLDGKEYIYFGPVDEDGPDWHDADETARVGGIFYLGRQMRKHIERGVLQ